MSDKYNFNVYPSDPSTLNHITGKGEEIPTILYFLPVLSAITGIVYFFINLFSGGHEWLICLCAFVISIILMLYFINESDKNYRIKKVKEEAESISKQLNELLKKSEEIVSNILPSFEVSAHKSIELAKVDFAENALSPFWNQIENASKYFAYYKEAIEQLVLNGELYSKVLEGKQHNFPKPFPIGANIPISQTILDEYNATIRKAQSKFEFANIWEHRKTQKILIAGFQTLEQAINNMKDAVVQAIANLGYSIKTEFRELKNIQIEQIRSFEACQATINNTLTSMDTKLYYLQYNEKPNTPFLRPWIE